MSEINQFGAKLRFNIDTTRQPPVKTQPTQTAPTVQEPSQSYFDLVSMADDMSAIAAQLRRRNEAEKSSRNASDPFDRILEEDAESRVEQLIFISHTSEISPQELMLQARALFPDDSDLILVLREIIKRRKLKNESTDVLEEVMHQVWQESNEKHCKAGINVGLKANVFANKMAVTPWALRDTYRQFLTSEEGELSQYEQWVEQYGDIRRYLVAEFIESSLLHDIQSHDPSCSREEFGMLLSHVVNFKKLLSSDKAFMQVFLKELQRGNLRRKEKQQESEQRKGQHGHQRGKEYEEEKQKEREQEIAREIEALACWFDCLQRPFKVHKEIEKNNLDQLVERFNLSKPVLQQMLLRAIKLLDGDLFFDAEAKEILIDALLNLDLKLNSQTPPRA